MQRPSAALAALGVALAGALLAASGCVRLMYNFASVEPGRIYRSAQPSPLLLDWLVRRHGLRAIVNLRGRTPGFESAFAAHHGLRLYSFDLSASRPPTSADVERFLAILSDPANHPLLVHCRNGVDRTGYMLALYRTERLGWGPDRAAREMNRFWQLEWLNAVPQSVVKEGLRAP
ncbi:MAG: tyrosine-protein phosphatase [Myxococcota bacterium]